MASREQKTSGLLTSTEKIRAQAVYRFEQEADKMFRKNLAVILLLFVASSLSAQNQLSLEEVETDWSVYVAGSPKECFIISRPKNWTAEREGEPVTVRRGDIRLYISIIPSEGVPNEPSFLAGYPLRQDSEVEIKIESEGFKFFPNADVHPEFAWPRPSDDLALIRAMQRGSTATLTGTSVRGTITTDTFSLIGFSAAFDKAKELCPSS